MKSLVAAYLFLMSGLSISYGQQCSVTANNNDYTVNLSLEVVDLLTTQSGPSCQYQIELAYDISFTGPNPPPNMFTLQGNLDCTPGGNPFFNLPNSPGTGTTLTANASLNNQDCSTLVLDCEVTIQINGPNLGNQLIDCGSINTSVLPVEFLSFQGTSRGNGVFLEWSTATEQNNQGFEVQCSAEGESWKAIGFVPGAGNTLSVQHYSFWDTEAIGQQYYRLRQLDWSGNYAYSPLITVRSSSEPIEKDIKLFPNPASNVLYIQADGQIASWQLFNSLGRMIREGRDASINMSGVAPGLYCLRLQQEDGRFIQRQVTKQ